ncbi:MAG: hypothetical protein ACOX37_01275 [Bacillota bacterium]
MGSNFYASFLCRTLRVDVGIAPCGQGRGLTPTNCYAIYGINVGADDHISLFLRMVFSGRCGHRPLRFVRTIYVFDVGAGAHTGPMKLGPNRIAPILMSDDRQPFCVGADDHISLFLRMVFSGRCGHRPLRFVRTIYVFDVGAGAHTGPMKLGPNRIAPILMSDARQPFCVGADDHISPFLRMVFSGRCGHRPLRFVRTIYIFDVGAGAHTGPM